MSLIYTDIKKGVLFKDGDEIFECLDSQFAKKNRQKGNNCVRLKNLKTGGVVSKTFHASSSFEEIELDKEEIMYIYTNKDVSIFSDKEIPTKRFEVKNGLIDGLEFLKEKTLATAVRYKDEIISVKLPIKVKLIVKEAPPNIKGNTATGGSKRVVLENGTIITTPLFINVGDEIVINTSKGIYIERG